MTKQILIVDNDELNLSFVKGLLEVAGFSAIPANSVNKARENLKIADIDMIISEFKLPDMSGADFIKILKADEALKKIPIIILTAYGLDDEIALISNVGANEIILKPLNVSMFLQAIKKYLE